MSEHTASEPTSVFGSGSGLSPTTSPRPPPTPEPAMSEHEERPWPENAWPTAEQWRDWFLTLDPDEQTEQAARRNRATQAALACIERQHDGRIAALAARLADAEARAEAAEHRLERINLDAQYDRCADRYLIDGKKFREALRGDQ